MDREIGRMSKRRGVFISYHDGRNDPLGGDLEYRRRFEELFHNRAEVIVSRSVRADEIAPNDNADNVRRIIRDQHLAQTSVTIVLVGARTWQRNHVDWEISATLTDTRLNSRSGLVRILLPTFPRYPQYTGETIPPRLWDNLERKYASLYGWTEDPALIEAIVEEAYQRRATVQPNNGRVEFGRNRAGEHW
jgi:MTH538 TIR-like domain (DUF1863)